MIYKIKVFSVITILLLVFSIFWYLQAIPFIQTKDYQSSIVAYQGFFNLKYLTGYYLMIFLPAFHFVFPDINNFELVRYRSRLSYFYTRLRKAFISSLAFSLILCLIVLIGTSVFFNISTLISQNFYMAIFLQFIQFSLVYGILLNCSNMLLDITNNVVVSIVTTVLVFILLTNIIFFELRYSFFFDDILIMNFFFEGHGSITMLVMCIFRMCVLYVITFLTSRYFFLLRDVK